MKAVVAAMEAFAQIMLRQRPALGPEYFRIGGAGPVSKRCRQRCDSETDDPRARAVRRSSRRRALESKKIGSLDGLRCLKTSAVQPTLRVIDGSKQLGRLKHNILAAGPELVIPEVMARGERLQDWWIRSLDPSYRQVRLTDLSSVGDLAAISYDAGVQLGAGRLQDLTVPLDGYDRKRLLAAMQRLERRYRQAASKLVDELLLGWRERSTMRIFARIAGGGQHSAWMPDRVTISIFNLMERVTAVDLT